MTTRTLIKSVGACALASAALTVASSAAFGAAAQTGSPGPPNPLTIGFPAPAAAIQQQDPRGVSIGASCPAWVGNDVVGLQFMSGSEVLYQLNPTTGPGGGNAQGQAVLLDNVTEDQHGNVTGYTLTDYTGHTHAWFDNKVNPNGATGNLQTWGAETVSFNGSAPDGSQISISVSEGGGTSATGHPSGWLHVKIVCS